MSRPTKPKNIHILKGTAKKNPARMRARENEPENINPLGNLPPELNKAEQEHWNTIKNESIEGGLGEADRLAVSLAAKLLARVYTEDGATAAELNILTRLLSQFGMTPTDRSKINLPAKKKPNPFADD